MKTALLSLVIAISVSILSVMQFDRYQKFTHATNLTLNELDKTVNAKLTEFNQELVALTQQGQHLSSEVKNTHWKVKEAEYYVSLADAQLQVNQDVGAASRLLSEALDKVKSLNDPNLLSLQEALTADINALEKIEVPNRQALWIKVSEIIQESQKLLPRHSTLNLATKETPAIIPTPTATDNWQAKLQRSFEEIKSLVKIRRYSKPIEPLLTETEQSMVQDILRSLLEQVRIAILNTEVELFQKSLKETHDWIATYYETNDSKVNNIQAVLSSLTEINLKPSLPNLTSPELFTALRQ